MPQFRRPSDFEIAASVITKYLPVTWGLRVREFGAARHQAGRMRSFWTTQVS